MHPFTLIFLAALLLSALARLWLAGRQIRHVAAHREAVPADFAEKIPLADHRKAADYTVAKTRLGMLNVVVESAVILAFTLGGGLQALADLWQGLFDNPYYRGLALIGSVVALSSLADLPLSLYRTFRIEARFGFNKMTLPLFFADLLKQLLLGALFGAPLVLCVLWLMGRMGDYWWLYVWLAWMGFNLLVLAIYPTFIAPFFNKFSPLDDLALKARIEKLLDACDFQAKGLFVMDGSKRSSHGNAYFTGFGKNRRIVLFDTLLQRLDNDEIEAVLAHELGHFKRRHIFKRIGLMFGLSLGFLALLGWLIDKPWFYSGLGVSTGGTDMALVLFFLAMPAFIFPFEPLFSLYSRKHEFEADDYATRHASAAHLARALVKLYQDNAATLTPDPLYSGFHDSHPAAAQRVANLQKAANTA
jgi:STE24 endopeptidase